MDVLIVDSSGEIIKRLKELLSVVPGISLIHEATNYREALSLQKKIAPAIVLADADLPGNKSAELIKKIRAGMNGTIIIIMALRMDEQLLFKYRSLGIDNIFDKYHDFEKIPELVAGIARKWPDK
jgi:two-component system nitrate/nitrite response regulator NarL